MWLRFLLVCAIAVVGPAAGGSADIGRNWWQVAAPVADLRKEPKKPGPDRNHDPLEESQLLYGDRVAVEERAGGWARVEAEGQSEWTHNRFWQLYPGWIAASVLVPELPDWSGTLVVTAKLGRVLEDPRPGAPVWLTLSVGTYLCRTGRREDWWQVRLLDGRTGWIRQAEASPAEELRALASADPAACRARLVQTARLFIGDPYYWGGRSAHDPTAAAPPHTSVDCSGLVGLAYRANGFTIPRDAHEQWMQARPIPREKLLPGDLVFLHDEKDESRVTHVMLYAGEGRVIEGPGTGMAVRETSLDSRLQETNGRRVSYGSYAELKRFQSNHDLPVRKKLDGLLRISLCNS